MGDVIEASRTKLGSLNPGCAYPLKLLPVGKSSDSLVIKLGTKLNFLGHSRGKKLLGSHLGQIQLWVLQTLDCVT